MELYEHDSNLLTITNSLVKLNCMLSKKITVIKVLMWDIFIRDWYRWPISEEKKTLLYEVGSLISIYLIDFLNMARAHWELSTNSDKISFKKKNKIK